MIKNQEFHDLGLKLFGPIVAPFVLDCAEKIISRDAPTIFFMREGHHLHELFAGVLRNVYGPRQWHPLHKINISRAFLFKLLLTEPSMVSYALSHPFKGTLEDLLRNRFALSQKEIGGLKDTIPLLQLELPKDKQLAVDLITSVTLSWSWKIGQGAKVYSCDERGIRNENETAIYG